MSTEALADKTTTTAQAMTDSGSNKHSSRNWMLAIVTVSILLAGLREFNKYSEQQRATRLYNNREVLQEYAEANRRAMPVEQAPAAGESDVPAQEEESAAAIHPSE